MNRHSPVPEYMIRSDKGEITATAFGSFADDPTLCLITGYNCGDLQVWNLKTYRQTVSWVGHSGHRVQWIGWHSNNCVVSYGRDGFVKFWKLDSNQTPICVDSLRSTSYTHCQCALTIEEPHYLAIPQEDSSVDIVKVTDRKTSYTATSVNVGRKLGALMCITFAQIENELLLLGGFEGGSMAMWTRHAMQPSSILDLFNVPVTCVDFNSETMRGIAGGTDDKLVTWEVGSSDKSPRLSIRQFVTITNHGTACVCIHPKALYVAAASWDNCLRIFSWKTMKPLAVLNIHTDSIQCLAFSCSSKVLLAAGSRDGRVSLWNLYNDRHTNCSNDRSKIAEAN